MSSVYTTIQPVKTIASTSLFGAGDRPIELRQEQKDAVKKAFRHFMKASGRKFLWNAKMRFGKTLCALELAKCLSDPMLVSKNFTPIRRTLIVTHRPVVKASWKDDFEKLFSARSDYAYGSRFEDDSENHGDFYALEQSVNDGKHYVFFASMQYLRRSTLVGGDNDEQLKKDLLTAPWDLVVVDEAHEGTRTALGQRVIDLLKSGENTRVLHLSGTPFNLYDDFSDEEIFNWDYIKEQRAKRSWLSEHPGEPNPYEDLPEIEIRTYDLGKLVKSQLGDNVTFQFKDFFKVRQGMDLNDDERGRFVHEDAVNRFLDLMCEDSEDNHYPFSTDEYRDLFNHTLWVVPGVKEAKALENLLKKHPVFGECFEIVNVAGTNDDDEARSDALDKVLKTMGYRKGAANSANTTRTITLSCGRLTTGVTVPPWTAVFYLKGSDNTSAATYMQTIFRVQSPYKFISDGKEMMKTKCYVFDFAPDRSLKMVAETAKFTSLSQKDKKYARASTSREKDIENMEDFLSFCPVISMEGGKMVEFSADKLFEQLDHVYIDRVVVNGFNDNSLYDAQELLDADEEALNQLGDLISKSTNMEKPKKATNTLAINKNGLTDKQKRDAERAKKKQRNKQPLTPEEEAALEAERKQREEERKERENRITILRGISLRIPLLMYGAKVDNEVNDDEALTLDNFTRKIDEDSWKEFMPRGVTKDMFNKFKKCYNKTIFEAAGRRYRELARQADDMTVEDRIQRITEIFSWFHNPDKETVLTPWRVVNMHMSDTLGGWCFFNERFDGPNQKEVILEDSENLFDYVDTNELRFVDQGDVTSEVFRTDDKIASRILEINSKTGLYPLYIAYTLYRNRVKNYLEQRGLIDDPTNLSVEEQQVIWDDVLKENIYVICNTRMASYITERTLKGFRCVNDLHIKYESLINRAQNDRDELIADLTRRGFWDGTTSKQQMKFSAIVSNPPYQDSSKNNHNDAVYHKFIDLAYSLGTYGTLITPGRFLFGAGDVPSEWIKKFLADERMKVVTYSANSKDFFPSVDIMGGIAITLCDCKHKPGPIGAFTHFKELNSIILKVKTESFKSFSDIIYSPALYKLSERAFNELSWLQQKVGKERRFRSNIFEKVADLFISDDPHDSDYYEMLGLISNKRVHRWIKKEYVAENPNRDAFKVIVPEANGSGAIGEVIKTPVIGIPVIGHNDIGHTESFISIGSFQSLEYAENVLKYIKTKFARTLLGTLKVTQHNLKGAWANVPLQDFTSSSDIDWSKSVAEIDQQLYDKYRLTQEERDFIESMIKPME